MMKLKLHISTCPNDTFMFDAMVHGRIDTEGLEFDLSLSDIEELNRGALCGEPDVTKLSYAVVPEVLSQYAVLNSGSALGRGNGPLLVSRHKMWPEEVGAGVSIAVPGLHTTAARLLAVLFPEATERRVYLFSDVADAVMSDECDAGVLIHEGRFTYLNRGLSLVADLGERWEALTGLPLPLGAIVVSRSLPREVQLTVDRVLRRSVEYAMTHPAASADFVRAYARELSDEVTHSHIQLFVNNYSVDLGEEGRRAVCRLIEYEDPKKIFV